MLNIPESTSSEELVVIFVKLSILVVHLNFVEYVVLHASSVNNESALSYAATIFLVIIIVITKHIFLPDNWKHGIRSSNNFTRYEFAALADLEKSPIEEAALPEFAKVNANLSRNLILFNDISWFNLMPRDQLFVISKDW